MSADEIRQRTQATWDEFYQSAAHLEAVEGMREVAASPRHVRADLEAVSPDVCEYRDCHRQRPRRAFGTPRAGARASWRASCSSPSRCPISRCRCRASLPSGRRQYGVRGSKVQQVQTGSRGSQVQAGPEAGRQRRGHEDSCSHVHSALSRLRPFAHAVSSAHVPHGRWCCTRPGRPQAVASSITSVSASAARRDSTLERFLADTESISSLVSYRAIRRLSVVARGGKMTAIAHGA